MEGRQRPTSKMFMMLIYLTMSFFDRIESLSITVDDVECVYEYVTHENDRVSGHFVVVDHHIFWTSNHTGVDLTVTSPAGSIVHSVKGTSGDKFEFTAPRSGMYKFCFHNTHRPRERETVSFYIHVGHIPNEHDLAKDEHLDPMNVKIAELKEALESVTAEQMYLKIRNFRQHYLNQRTQRRVIFCTVGEYLLLALVSTLQVLYIRRLFSKSVAYNQI